MIVRVNEENLLSAAQIHAESWQDSHRAFCSEEFVKQHTAAHQKSFLEQELREGKQLYMLVKEIPVGIVSVQDRMIEHLYVLPSQQNKGYGTQLLLFAMEKCNGRPCLWVLDNNKRAQALYARYGFHMTGKANAITPQLSELEMEI